MALRCILLKFYIKPQLCWPLMPPHWRCILLKFYIKPQRRRTCKFYRERCILLKFYIKPQRSSVCRARCACCILLKFYIKPQRLYEEVAVAESCILLKFYIKPQRSFELLLAIRCCILLKFYIKPQLQIWFLEVAVRCILLKFYIKPQLRADHVFHRASCILLKFYIKPQLVVLSSSLSSSCILLKFYIKPQRRGRHLLNFSALYRSSWSENRMRKRRRSEFDVLFSISKNENTVFLEKFQLLRHIRLRPFTFAPEVENVSILFVCHRQNTCKSCRRHWPSNAIDVNLHVLFRGTMPDVHRILHHREAVFLQRLAELCRMTPFGFGIGRQIEKDKQPHDPIGIQSCFWHGLIPTRDMILFSVCRRSILLWKRL